MSDRIFRSIMAVAMIVLMASLVFILLAMTDYFFGNQSKQLRIELDLAARGVELSGVKYFERLDVKDYRITLISRDGTVLYDNEAETAVMENHLARQEVKDALEKGYGESSRYSSTLAMKQRYVARRLQDGSVLRLSCAQPTMWALLLGFAQPICFVILLALILSLLLALRLSGRIGKSINLIDPDHPEAYIGKEEYKEIEPLLRRMDAQQVQIRHDQEELQKTAQLRQEFTANVSHELKTPLHAISGYAEILEAGLVRDEDVRPFAGKIREESLRLTRLVEDIMDVTELDEGAENMSWESVDLYRVAENVIDSLQSQAEGAGVALLLKGSSVRIFGIPQVLHSMLYNLCDNAIKYNRRGGRVEVTVTGDDTEVLLQVRDTGIGIPAQERDAIFERFYRVDKSHSKSVGGTGLGLAIVKHGAMIHHARVEVDSAPGEGTDFRLRFAK
ncbi:ATP-binding protein [Eubacterium sp. AB3007]|uniref:sensor histidine kinase n=1 Tax=Eubacterium sp. AB3007 TaxID=1392487 RepID=UPI0004871E5F|nr:ATP-binding protein [Eubacterium sp. AB3007]